MSQPAVLACCSTIYSHPLARVLLGDHLHPGGAALTERLLDAMGVGAGTRLLDVAAGTGATARLAARRHGCAVVAVEQSAALVDAARAALVDAAGAAGAGGPVRVLQGNAEALPLADGSVDAVVCECALCTFARPEVAVAEWWRALRAGGTVGLADVTRQGPLPASMDAVVAQAACLAGARPAGGYRGLLAGAGFTVTREEDHGQALAALAASVQDKLVAAQLLAGLGHLRLPEGTLPRAREILRDIRGAIAGGRLGYTLWVAEKPAPPGGGRPAAIRP